MDFFKKYPRTKNICHWETDGQIVTDLAERSNGQIVTDLAERSKPRVKSA